eukprot:TRINITY_DN3427_c0_g2_i1.p1 TRINITY_DN3427_c0_g2~~TRINITY_DN3427_c0_g2_i1.p1  ORF type:complete len:740 (-),score=94.15 TRINITY_DN3427_c0_g2_i1:40-2259(-)
MSSITSSPLSSSTPLSPSLGSSTGSIPKSNSSSSLAGLSANSSSSNTTLSRKLKKVLDIKTDNPDFLSALNHLSSFYTNNNVHSRRSLRDDIERSGISINHQLLLAYQEVQNCLEDVVSDVQAMRVSCDVMSKHLEVTRESSGKLIESAALLREQQKRNEEKARIVNSMLERFQLSEQEQAILSSTTNVLTAEFFDALKKVHLIHQDCKLLLRTHHQRAGLEIMELMNTHLESAYRRLYRWVRDESARSLDPTPSQRDTPYVHPLMPTALKSLQERPVLLAYCLDEIAASRSKSIVKAFLNALTQGGPNGLPRPIEMHAHDPLRYVGDMLAWIHQAIASEHELLSGIIGTTSDPIALPSPHSNNSPSDSSPSLQRSSMLPTSNSTGNLPVDDSSFSRSLSSQTLSNTGGAKVIHTTPLGRVLNVAFEGVCRPFKVRLDQVLQTTPDVSVVVLYRLANLLDFYTRTVTPLLSSNSSLATLFLESKQDCLKVFYNRIKSQGERNLRTPPIPPSDLSPPVPLRDVVNHTLKDLITTFNASLVPIEERTTEFAPVLSAVIDPLLQMCSLSATLTPLDLSSMAVYMINCISSIQTSLSNYDFTAPRIEMLAAQVDAHMDTLVEEQTSVLLNTCGLGPKLTIIQYRDSMNPLSQVSGMDRQAILATVQQFESSLVDLGSLVLPLPQVDMLSSPRLRSQARRSVLHLISVAYNSFYLTILDPVNKYHDPVNLFNHDPDQIRTMLDV